MRIALRMAVGAAVLACLCSGAKAERSPNLDLLEGVRFSAPLQPGHEFSRGLIAFHGPTDLTALTSHPILAEAARYLGRGNPTGTHGPWCADFAAFVLRRTGHHPPPTRMAIGMLAAGRRVPNPQPGDLVVMRHHVTFFVVVVRDRILGLGGNQGRHIVKISSYPATKVVAFVRPQ